MSHTPHSSRHTPLRTFYWFPVYQLEWAAAEGATQNKIKCPVTPRPCPGLRDLRVWPSSNQSVPSSSSAVGAPQSSGGSLKVHLLLKYLTWRWPLWIISAQPRLPPPHALVLLFKNPLMGFLSFLLLHFHSTHTDKAFIWSSCRLLSVVFCEWQNIHIFLMTIMIVHAWDFSHTDTIHMHSSFLPAIKDMHVCALVNLNYPQ